MFNQNDIGQQVAALRSQGLTDNLIVDELKKQGINENDVISAISQMDAGGMSPPVMSPPGMPMQNDDFIPPAPSGPPPMPPSTPSTNIYERVEEVVESIVDEKWDDLISEVKKIVDWKDKIEQRQARIESDLVKLKEDFKTLHGGVLGKLDQYDNKMREVGTELNAVGKVFKDVVPEFVENVKELSSLTNQMKK